MKTCKICGKAMDESFNVCPYCGAGENQEESNAQTQQQNTYQQNPYAQQNNFYQQPNQAQYQNSYNQQQYTQPKGYTPAPRPQRSAYIAAFLAIFGGMFGLYNFYLDNKKTATIQLVVALAGIVLTFGIATVAIEVWAVIDAIKILKGEINTDGTGALIKMGW